MVQVDPVELRKTAVGFKVADGLLPQQKQMHSDEFAVALQTIQSTPALQQGYDVVPLFSYIMELRGLEGLEYFEKSPLQLQYEQALAQWQQVAMEAIKAGQQSPPQPQMPPELIQELQQKAAARAPKQATQAAAPASPAASLNPQAAAQGAELSGLPEGATSAT